MAITEFPRSFPGAWLSSRNSDLESSRHRKLAWMQCCPPRRVHPTPIYEFLVAIVIFWILWRLGERCFKTHAPNGIVFSAYLVLTGIARFLVEIIRINPRSFYGLTNAQAASVVSVIAGIILFLSPRASMPPRRA